MVCIFDMDQDLVQNKPSLGGLRSRIDDLDGKIIQLLNERASVSVSIGTAKKDLG